MSWKTLTCQLLQSMSIQSSNKFQMCHHAWRMKCGRRTNRSLKQTKALLSFDMTRRCLTRWSKFSSQMLMTSKLQSKGTKCTLPAQSSRTYLDTVKFKTKVKTFLKLRAYRHYFWNWHWVFKKLKVNSRHLSSSQTSWQQWPRYQRFSIRKLKVSTQFSWNTWSPSSAVF